MVQRAASAVSGSARVLIVEDDGLIALALSSTVEGFGYRVAGVSATAMGAIAFSDTEAPDLILMDVNLKGDMSGIEAAKRIRRRHDVPIIFVTAYSSPEVIGQIRAIASAGVLSKPVLPNRLRAAMAEALLATEAHSA